MLTTVRVRGSFILKSTHPYVSLVSQVKYNNINIYSLTAWKMVAEGCWLSFSKNFLLWLLVTVAHSLHGRPLLICKHKHNASQSFLELKNVSCKPESIQSNVYFKARRSLFLAYDTLFRVSLAPVYFRANCGNLLAAKIISNQAGNAHFFPCNQWLH